MRDGRYIRVIQGAAALLTFGDLLGFCLASIILGNRGDPYRMVLSDALVGLSAFAFVKLAAPVDTPSLFLLGNFMIRLGAALFGHGTLTATWLFGRADYCASWYCYGC